ncbi:MAG TPA: PhzF family phenazine biosynthesis protein [Dehalococcoidia bacterium]|nr:PhzF family phenazine biosynthesis protein [Dehalococcoidia bacterium]
MREIPLRIVDAFTDRPFAGNPAGVVLDAEGLDEATMQAIAREVNLSETAFVTPSQRADFRVRFFTPTTEIPLAGHPTIATMHALVEAGRIQLGGPRTRVTQELNVGVLPVDLEADAGGRLTRIWMTQKPPEFLRIYDAAPYAEALGIPIAGIEPDFPVQTVSTGTPQLMFPVRSLHVLERLRPDFTALTALQAEGDYFSLHVFAPEGYAPEAKAHARHFAPAAGIAEDPVTGSASGGMGAYLVRYGLVQTPSFMTEQGHIVGRPGTIYIEVDGEDEQITGVRVGGRAVTVTTGTMRIP